MALLKNVDLHKYELEFERVFRGPFGGRLPWTNATECGIYCTVRPLLLLLDPDTHRMVWQAARIQQSGWTRYAVQGGTVVVFVDAIDLLGNNAEVWGDLERYVGYWGEEAGYRGGSTARDVVLIVNLRVAAHDMIQWAPSTTSAPPLPDGAMVMRQDLVHPWVVEVCENFGIGVVRWVVVAGW